MNTPDMGNIVQIQSKDGLADGIRPYCCAACARTRISLVLRKASLCISIFRMRIYYQMFLL